MKKLLAVSLLAIGAFSAQAQNVNITSKTSEVKIFSKTPVEDIEAVNKKARAIINPNSMDIAVRITNTDFDFPNNLMEEHFNEKYMESEKYPTSIFTGKINKKIDFTVAGTYEVEAVGKLNMHGVTKDKTLKGTIVVSESGVVLKCNFDVLLVDFNIERPSIVMAKIAEKIDIVTVFSFPLKK
jgi:polyisoprenoid-binding protein YceI